jgi:hypothetical protein
VNYTLERKALEATLNTLCEHAWERDITLATVNAWLSNFVGKAFPQDDERLYALFLLTRFVYFGKRMVREMLASLYRDHVESPLKQRIRKQCRGSRDFRIIQRLYDAELNATRFVGVGNPSESGAHLLYYFRQVNHLRKGLFVDSGAAFKPVCDCQRNSVSLAPTDPKASRYIFFDDVVVTGDQATKYLGETITGIRKHNPQTDIRLLTLFSTPSALSKLNQPHYFAGKASTLFELDQTFCAFSSTSRYFRGSPSWFTLGDARHLAKVYGTCIQPERALGYRGSELLLGFAHNTPDNSLPIFWDEGRLAPWIPIFPRYDKKYS